MRYENKALRNLARGAPCTIQIPGICNGDPETSVWAHSNHDRHGHGKSIKAHDVFGAISCSACHFEIDQGKHLNRWEKQDYWIKGFEETLLYIWTNGLVGVAGANSRVQKPKEVARPSKGNTARPSKILARTES